jgi:hypothetical protein
MSAPPYATMSRMAKTTARYADALQAYDTLVATNPKVARKGKTMPYTSVNGHMFSVLTKDGTPALRLPSGDRDAFLVQHRTTPCKMYGMVMEEYVVVPDALLKNTRSLKKYFDASYGYVSALKPKPTSKAAARRTRA